MGKAEDAIRQRQRLEAEIGRERHSPERIREQVREEIPLALGRLAAQGYPGGEILDILEPVEHKHRWFEKNKPTAYAHVGTVAAWCLLMRTTEAAFDSRDYTRYYLTAEGKLATQTMFSMSPPSPLVFYETDSDPAILDRIQHLGVDYIPYTAPYTAP